jgi:hypothetical protein
MSTSSSASSRPKALSRLADDELLFRTTAALGELHPLVARETTGPVLVLGGPQVGKSELLRLAFDRLFFERRRSLPCYFSLRRDRLTPEKFARDFLTTLLRHYLAFAHSDADLVSRTDATERDLLGLAQAAEYPVLKEALDGLEARLADGDEAALVRYALAAPQRLSARGPYHVVALLDEAQLLDRLALALGEDAAALLGEVVYAPHAAPLVLAGQQRALLDQLAGESGLLNSFKIVHLAPPDGSALQPLVEQWCVRGGVPFERETLRLAVQQLDCNLSYLRAVVSAASERKLSLEKGADFERLYAAELLQGRLAHQFSGQMRRAAQDATGGVGVEHAALESVYVCAEAIASRAPVEMIERRLKPRVPAQQLLNELHHYEMVTLLDGHVLPSDDPVFCDWIRATHRRFEGVAVEEVRLDLLRRRIKGVPAMLAISARRSLHARLEELLKRFDGQSVARSLFAHDEFVIRYGRATYENMLAGLRAEAERVELPQVVHVAESHLFAPRPEGGTTIWSCLLAYGFDGGIYDHEHEVIWLLAVADAPSAVTEEAVAALDFQLKEIEAALAAGEHAPRLTRWAISKMGFTPDGTLALEERGFAASDYLQLELLTECLNELASGAAQPPGGAESPGAAAGGPAEGDDFDQLFKSHAPLATTPAVTTEAATAEAVTAETATPETAPPEPTAAPPSAGQAEASAPGGEAMHARGSRDFEMAIPMNDDKEIIAARVAEQMARGLGFAPEAVNQIKTALIESCLSLSAGGEAPDSRIHQRYRAEQGRLTITVSNTAAGLDAAGGEAVEDDPERVWRLDVLRSLVDEVRLVRLADGWRVTLTRFVA